MSVSSSAMHASRLSFPWRESLSPLAGLGTFIASVPPLHRSLGAIHAFHVVYRCGVLSITVFPVLCRILTELKILDTTVEIVMFAGVGNDIVGWTLLTLSIALVNAGSGLTAMLTLLICVAFAIFLP
ncbi:hypothetical protein F5J12DRAFT_293737 [Pisolithus orientalis]|uniref:uncharacterized protein n=1 Tax=Pisolithus orientalis TaxID=936130 RepID=UPI0022258E09|nr:uncharacterized protein F5J12DRAFT_293737 [Pisolithus orientalis]KAI6030465.1 hypothetical protein F5J12DRAFT_293737 [Pisolithus orientalis]